jgi:hypothetical protein
MSTNLKGKYHELLVGRLIYSFQRLNMSEPEEKISLDSLPLGNVYSFVYSFAYSSVYSFVTALFTALLTALFKLCLQLCLQLCLPV